METVLPDINLQHIENMVGEGNAWPALIIIYKHRQAIYRSECNNNILEDILKV